jgi:phosphatidate cytidylyltransferase
LGEASEGEVTKGKASESLRMATPTALPRDLKPRALSAAVMAVVALGATWAGPGPFAVLVLAIGLVMAWEWSRIVRHEGLDGLLILHGGVVAAAVGLTVWGAPLPAVGLVLLGTLAMAVVGPRPRAVVSALGVSYVALPAIAMIWLRGADDWGALAILFVFAIVWTTDTFAYFCGRLIGGPKLCPPLSPGKTWSGTLGGIAFAALAGALFAILVPRSAPLALALVAIGLSILAQIGDLAESALKRAFAVKNASDLIPGHGGFMDRMDGIVAAASVAALLAVMRGAPSPAQALLFWS